MAKKQKNGLYRSKVKIGVDAQGKDIVKYISGKTMKELETAKRETIAQYITGSGLEEDQLLGVYAKKWFKVKCQSIEASSVQSYRTALNKDILPVFGARNLRAIKPSDLQAFVAEYAGRSATKITYVVAALDGIFEAACVDRILDHNPMEHVQKPEASDPEEKRALTEDERATIERVAATHQDGAYLAAMYYLGARPGEIRGLQWGDFDWGNDCVFIQRDIDYKANGQAGELKNKSSRRKVPVPPALKDILWPLRAMPEMYVFRGKKSGAALSKSTAERLWVQLMLECGMVRELAKGENKYRECDIRSRYAALITPHVMRHNYITMCWESGIDVYTTMKLVGHKSITTTLNIYTHLSAAQMEAVMEQVADMFSAKDAEKKKVAQKLHNSL